MNCITNIYTSKLWNIKTTFCPCGTVIKMVRFWFLS